MSGSKVPAQPPTGKKGPSAGARVLARIWIKGLKEPALLLGALYAWISAVGFAHLFGTGQGIGVNTIDLASPSDFLISGLRNPVVTLLAVASGCGIFCALGRAVKRGSSGMGVFGAAAGVLLVCIVLSASYRRSVTSGFLSHYWGSPCPVVVSAGSGETRGRFGTATADFIVIVQDRNQSIVLQRDKVERMQLDCSETAFEADKKNR